MPSDASVRRITEVGDYLHDPSRQRQPRQRLIFQSIMSRSNLHRIPVAIHRPAEHHRHLLL